MSKNEQQIRKRGAKISEYPIMGLSMVLRRSPLAGAGRIVLAVLRLLWKDRSIGTEHSNTSVEPLPRGPFEMRRPQQLGDMLLWVPRKFDSYLIDDLTGGYGYSHTTIDTGEIDVPTQRPVMAEITVGQTVERKFQDEYGQRAFVRVPLAELGLDVEQFVECVKSKLGEQYDSWDAITLGAIQDPAREVCSGLAADCLPDKALRQIAWARRLGLMSRQSVSLHSRANALKTRAFISPNGFAEYYGLPKGRKIKRPDTLVEPEPINVSVTEIAKAAARRHGWKLAVLLLGIAGLAVVVYTYGGRGGRNPH